MPKPYDAASKAIIEACPEGWVRLAGHQPVGPVEVINVDLSAVTSAADFALKVQIDGETWLIHIEFVSNSQPGLPYDLALRNALLCKRSSYPVETVVILLDPLAYRRELSGVHETRVRGKRQSLLEYQVIKIYEKSVEELLGGPAAIAPMAVLSREVRSQEDVALVLDRLHDRLAELLPDDLGMMKELWTTAELYLGLKFKGEDNKAWIKALTRGVLSVKDSIMYQDIFEEGEAAGLDKGRKEGRAEGRVEILMRFGIKRWGQPDAGEKVALEAITDIDRLNRMFDRTDENPHSLSSWSDLLQIQ